MNINTNEKAIQMIFGFESDVTVKKYHLFATIQIFL